MFNGTKFFRSRLTAVLIGATFAAALVDQTKAGYGIEFGPSVGLGDTLGGTFSETFDWSSYSGVDWEFGVVMSLQGLNPNLPFSAQFFDSGFSTANYQGETTGMLASDTFIRLTLIEAPSFHYSKVFGMQFTWDGGGTISTFLTYVAARNVGTDSVINLSALWSGAYTVDPGATTASYTQTSAPEPINGGSFTARAPGGVRFISSAAATGADLPPGASAWQALSDRNAKTDITAIDPRAVLQKVSGLPVTAWHYKHDPNRDYIGPMAQDFRQTFGLGFDDKHISTLDTDGVTLAALQGLITELQERQERSTAQARRLAELEAQLRTLREEVQGHPGLPTAADQR